MFDFGLLSNAALTGLSDTEKESLQKQATSQFLLGSLLSNDPAMGYKAAMGVPEQYTSTQKAISEAAEKKRQRDDLSAFTAKYAPTQTQAAQQSFVQTPGRTSTDFGPSPQAAQRQEARLNAPIDFEQAYKDSLRLVGNPGQAQILNTLSSLQPKVQGNLLMNPNRQIIGGIPSFDAKTGLVSTPNVQGGRVNFDITPASGFRNATAQNTLPPLLPNQEYIFNANQNVVGVRNADGSIEALTEKTLAEELARGEARLRTTPTNVIDLPTGRTKRVTEAQALNMPTALSPSEQQAYEGYKQTRDAAFKGFESAKSSDASLQNMQNILNRGAFEPGKFAPFKAEVSAIATGLGIGGDKAKRMATDAPLLVQSFGDITSSKLQEMSGAISNADLTFSAARGPQITNPKDAVQFYIDLNKELNQRKKDYFNYVTKNPVPDVVEKWSQTSQGSASVYESPKMRKYLPSFPVASGPDKGKTAYQLPTGVYRVYD